MSKERKMQMVGRIVSFAEAEELDVAYYASLDWKESVSIVEEMRVKIWNKAYKEHNEVEKIIRKASLTEDRDDFER